MKKRKRRHYTQEFIDKDTNIAIIVKHSDRIISSFIINDLSFHSFTVLVLSTVSVEYMIRLVL
jgi:hypothetical protein